MRKYLPIVALALILTGCAGTPETRATNALGIACDAYASALLQLAAVKQKMSERQIGQVDGVNKVIDPICSPGSEVKPAEAVKTVRDAIDTLKKIKEAF